MAKFKPGKSGNPQGRGKGIPNKTTSEVREMLTRAVTGELENLQQTLAGMEPEQRLNTIAKFLPFFMPKLQATALAIEKKEPPDITIQYVDVDGNITGQHKFGEPPGS